jgi:choline dehydrogenase
VCQLRPKSRGRILLRGADPALPPAIHPGYLDDESDCAVLRAGLRYARRIAAQPAIGELIEAEFSPGGNIDSDADLTSWIRTTASSVFHPVGTCKMGTDPQAVVDARLRVHQLEGLRVVDASVMPTLVSGNTNAPTIMIAERAADMIRGVP